MTYLVRLSKFVRYLMNFIVHFAHGGLVMVGTIVMACAAYQFIQFGPEGLDPRAMFGYRSSGQEALEVAMMDESLDGESGADRIDSVPKGYERVAAAIARRHKVSPVVVETLVKAAVKEGRVNGIDPMLILAVITVESRFNPFAESAFGAQGLMQVIPKFHTEKIAMEKGRAALFDPMENIRVGTMILKSYIRSTGSLEAGLQMYGGASSDPDMSYAAKVQQEFVRLRAISHATTMRTALRASEAPDA